MNSRQIRLLSAYSFFRLQGGFGCGDGWLGIIEELCQKLLLFHLPNFYITQIKEKNGVLRISYKPPENGTNVAAVNQLIETAENKSSETCELCGRPARLAVKKCRILTRCSSCIKKGG